VAKEPHHFRFAVTDGEARLNLHDDATGEYLNAFIVVEYKEGLAAYRKLPLGRGDALALIDWFASEDGKPF